MLESGSFSFDPADCLIEKEVETKLIVPLLLSLGYQTNSWYQEVAFGRIRLDFLAFATQIIRNYSEERKQRRRFKTKSSGTTSLG